MHDGEGCDESDLEAGGVGLIEQARYSPFAPVWPSIALQPLSIQLVVVRPSSIIARRLAHHDHSSPRDLTLASC